MSRLGTRTPWGSALRVGLASTVLAMAGCGRAVPASRSSKAPGASSSVGAKTACPAATEKGPNGDLNLAPNPCGLQGTTDWVVRYLNNSNNNAQAQFPGESVTSTSVKGQSAILWKTSPQLTSFDYVRFTVPVVTGTTYRMSAQVQGTGVLAIDIWDGNNDNYGPSVTLGNSWQTMVGCATIQTQSADHPSPTYDPNFEIRLQQASDGPVVADITNVTLWTVNGTGDPSCQ